MSVDDSKKLEMMTNAIAPNIIRKTPGNVESLKPFAA